MKRIIVLAAMLSIVGMQGYAQQVCPVQINSANPDRFNPFMYGNRALEIKYTNVSNKVVTMLQFGVVYTNQLEKSDPQLLTMSQKLKPAKQGTAVWNGVEVAKSMTPGSYARVTPDSYSVLPNIKAFAALAAVSFADGSIWQNDGSSACSDAIDALLKSVPETKPVPTTETKPVRTCAPAHVAAPGEKPWEIPIICPAQ